jgi:hypothetical protein
VGIRVPVRLKTIEAYVAKAHGSPRELTADEDLVLFDHVERIVAEIDKGWPVDTSTSRDAFSFETVGREDWIGFIVINPVPYAEYVHLKGTPIVPELWRTLIPAEVDVGLPALFKDLKAAIDETEAEIAVSRESGGRGLLDVIARLRRGAA